MTNYSTETLSLIVGILMMGGLSMFGFLARKAFGDLADGLKELRTEVSTKLDSLVTGMHQTTLETAVLRARIDRMESELNRVQNELRKIVQEWES